MLPGVVLYFKHSNLQKAESSKARLFADDTAIYLAISNPTQSSVLQKDLETLEKWETNWNMEFNPSKCQVIHVTRRQSPFQTSYYLHNVLLESVPTVKYLGVDINNNLSWDAHIDRIAGKANQTLGFLRRNIKTRSKSVKTLAYQTLVRPHSDQD